MKKILVVATHPDDETLGCGGTILKKRLEGSEIAWLIITGMSKSLGYEEEIIKKRNDEINKVSKAFNFAKTYNLNIPTTTLSSSDERELISSIALVINEYKPDTVFLPFCYDVHSDHRTTFSAIFSCIKIFKTPFIKRVLMMETISETDFVPSLQHQSFCPNYYVNIDEQLEQKLSIMKIYSSEIKQDPFPRSIEKIKAFASYRGSVAGCPFAEAFMILRWID